MEDLLKEWKKKAEKDKLANARALGELDALKKLIKATDIPPMYKEIIDTLLNALEQIGKNRLDIQDINIRYFRSTEFLQRQIDILSERVAGHERNR